MKKILAILEVPDDINPSDVTVSAMYHAYTVSSVYGAFEIPNECSLKIKESGFSAFCEKYGLGINSELKAEKNGKDVG